MLTTRKKSNQIGLFNAIEDLIDQKHPLFLLANAIDWLVFDEHFKNTTVKKWVNLPSQSG